MKERPILFSGAMVRSLLNCTKSQTRRVVKPQPEISADGNLCGEWLNRPLAGLLLPKLQDIAIHCPYGEPGDRLWVKETFFAFGRWETRFSAKKGRDEWHFVDMTIESGKPYRYAANIAGDNGPRQRGGITPQWWKRPAIFMPRHASRLLLQNNGVRVERLQDISEADAIAEGIDAALCEQFTTKAPDRHILKPAALHAYAGLWEAINGAGSWEANPWVWAVEFKRVTS